MFLQKFKVPATVCIYAGVIGPYHVEDRFSRNGPTVAPTKSDSDVILCFTIAKYNTNVYTSLELTRINRSRVF